MNDMATVCILVEEKVEGGLRAGGGQSQILANDSETLPKYPGSLLLSPQAFMFAYSPFKYFQTATNPSLQ